MTNEQLQQRIINLEILVHALSANTMDLLPPTMAEAVDTCGRQHFAATVVLGTNIAEIIRANREDHGNVYFGGK
jgi:hypothetical protein